MGQRHQVFLKVLNPVNNDRLFAAKGERDKAIKAFGDGKYTIMAFHHQWLYGRSAAVNILNMLMYTNLDTANDYGNPFSGDYMDYSLRADTLEAYMKTVNQLLNVQPNPLHPRGIGFERMIFLNREDPDMRLHFDRGDNNDGITIVDTITGKYCMMNIYDYQEEDYRSDSSSDLPYLKPVSARRYMKAYYPEKVELLSDYRTDGKTPEEIEFAALENRIENNKVDREIKRMSKGILKISELKEMFPEFYQALKV